MIDGNVLRAIHFTGGCNGNLKGIGSLVAGMKVKDVISRLEGIDCAEKNGGMTAEQLATAINVRRLHVRKDGQPVSTKQIWWAVKTFSSTLTYAEGRIFLLI